MCILEKLLVVLSAAATAGVIAAVLQIAVVAYG